jgi:hypothetical protein
MQVFLREDGSLDFDSEKRGEVVKMGSELWSRLNGVCVCVCVCMCVCVCVYCVCVCVCINTHTYAYLCICIYIYIYMRGGGKNGVTAVQQTKRYTVP